MKINSNKNGIQASIFFLLITAMISTRCNGSGDTKKNMNLDSTTVSTDSSQLTPTDTFPSEKKQDSIQNLAKKELELEELSIRKDTLEIVSSSPFLYYPTGKFPTIGAFSNAYSGLRETKQIDKTNDVNTILYRFEVNQDYVKFVEDHDKRSIEIVSGKIASNKIGLLNGIRIGISKNEFLKKFFTGVPDYISSKIKIVTFVSALDGISHIYVFDNSDRLSLIRFDTDYIYENKD